MKRDTYITLRTFHGNVTRNNTRVPWNAIWNVTWNITRGTPHGTLHGTLHRNILTEDILVMKLDRSTAMCAPLAADRLAWAINILSNISACSASIA